MSRVRGLRHSRSLSWKPRGAWYATSGEGRQTSDVSSAVISPRPAQIPGCCLLDIFASLRFRMTSCQSEKFSLRHSPFRCRGRTDRPHETHQETKGMSRRSSSQSSSGGLRLSDEEIRAALDSTGGRSSSGPQRSNRPRNWHRFRWRRSTTGTRRGQLTAVPAASAGTCGSTATASCLTFSAQTLKRGNPSDGPQNKGKTRLRRKNRRPCPIRQRGETWYANWQENGRQQRESLKTTSLKEARTRARRIEREIEERAAGLTKPIEPTSDRGGDRRL